MKNEIKLCIADEADKNRKLVLLVIAAAVVLSAASLLAHIYHLDGATGSRMAVALFSVDEETSITTWWATVVLAATGLLAAVSARVAGETRGERLTLYLLAGGFLLLSADEAAMLHERAGYLLESQGALQHARWMIIWLPLAAVPGTAVLWMVWRVSRALFKGLLLGAIVFLAGAVVMEAVNSTVRYDLTMQGSDADSVPAQVYDASSPQALDSLTGFGRQSLPYIIGTTIEELLEMLGAAIWLAAVLNYGQRRRERENE